MRLKLPKIKGLTLGKVLDTINPVSNILSADQIQRQLTRPSTKRAIEEAIEEVNTYHNTAMANESRPNNPLDGQVQPAGLLRFGGTNHITNTMDWRIVGIVSAVAGGLYLLIKHNPFTKKLRRRR